MAYQQTLPVDTELIGDFRILGLLGSGGFANTYLALDLTLSREVAIKEFFPSDLAIRANTQSVAVKSAAQESQFQWAMGRFVREAKTLAQFRHPSVVRVYRVFNANDTAYIVLEFVRGANMGAWLKRLQRPPTQAELDELLPPLLDALEVVHNAGILHRDIKPANIYIREADQTPVLLDFGAAKYAASGAGDHGTTAAIVSKGYSPNEAYATDSRLQGPWTDLYGLAATLYRALTGSAPPESTSRILNDECVPAASMPALVGNYRPEFLVAIDWALAVIPKDRPQSVAQWRKQVLPSSSERPSRADSRPSGASEPEWRPLSDSPPDEATVYSKNLPSAPSAPGSERPSRESKGEPLAPPSARGMPPSGGASGARTPTAPSRPRTPDEGHDSVASEPTIQPVAVASRGWASNPMLLAGVVLLAAGAAGLASQWIGGDSKVARSDRTAARETHVAALDADREAERQRLAREAEEAERVRKAEEARRAEEAERARKEQEAAERARQQEAERQRLAREAEEAERVRKAEEARHAEEAERARKEQEAAERARQEAERQRLAREAEEAERARKAEEARRAEEAERARKEQEAAEKAKQEEEERARQQQEAARKAEEERLAKAAAEEQRLKQEEEARKTQEASTAGTSETAPSGTQVAALETPDASPTDRRRDYLSRMQTALKERACYTGSITGDLDDTAQALNTFETSYKGTPRTINLASATDGDFDDWLGWFAALKDADCVIEPSDEKKPASPPSRRVQSKSKSSTSQASRPKSQTPAAGPSRDSLLRGGR